MKAKYNVGDIVKVVKYGHLSWSNKKFEGYERNLPIYSENEDIVVYDTSIGLVGGEGIVVKVIETQGKPPYHYENCYQASISL